MPWTPERIAALTDPASFERGERYAAEGRVDAVRTSSNGVITARVRGSELYTVRLTDRGGRCDCRMGDEGVFCKHCVAVALTVTEPLAARPYDDPVAGWLATLSLAELIDLVLSAAKLSDSFAAHLSLQAARSDVGLTKLKAEIDHQLRTRRYLDWRQSTEFARDAGPVIDVLGDLVTDGRAADAIPLIRRAIGHVTKVIGRADDSNGSIGDLTGVLLGLHAEACRAAPPNPAELVRWLVKYGLDEQDWFTVDVDEYAEALGGAGLSSYRKEIERRAAAGDSSFAVQRAEVRLAIVAQDVGAVVRLLGGDLTRGLEFVRVAEALQEMGRYDEMLAYALRGIATRTDWQARKLYEVARAGYERRGETGAVLALTRRELAAYRDHLGFARLRTAAQIAGCWDDERGPALEVLAVRPRDHVLALIDEDPDGAWDVASAASDAVGTDLWLRLADLRAVGRPADAIPVYRSAIENALRTADRRNYATAVVLLKRMRKAATSAGESAQFASYVVQLRETHRRRPTFITMLNKARLG